MDATLEPLGISDREERVYRTLLRIPRSSAAQLAGATGLSRREVNAVLLSLEEKGLLGRVPESTATYVAAPPDLAVEGLIHRRQADLQRARMAIPGLLDEFRARDLSVDSPDLVELVRGREAVAERAAQLQRSAESEVTSLSSPPYATSVVNEEEASALSRGVRYRVIYTSQALEVPGVLDGIRRDVEGGEEARILPEIPVKLVMVDRKLGLVPLSKHQEFIEGAVLLHPSTLLDALYDLFEILWERAVPLSFRAGHVEADDHESDLASSDERLLTLLVGGLKDEAIARQLGMAPRTLRRRIAALSGRLGAVSRFQAGYQAARKGW